MEKSSSSAIVFTQTLGLRLGLTMTNTLGVRSSECFDMFPASKLSAILVCLAQWIALLRAGLRVIAHIHRSPVRCLVISEPIS